MNLIKFLVSILPISNYYDNIEYINKHNSGNHSYQLEANQFVNKTYTDLNIHLQSLFTYDYKNINILSESNENYLILIGLNEALYHRLKIK